MSSLMDSGAMERALEARRVLLAGFWGQCSHCLKNFGKKYAFERHWRLPVPCQMPDCFYTVRDDKRQDYLNHHRQDHNVGGHLVFSEAEIDNYHEVTKRRLGKVMVEFLCEKKMIAWDLSQEYLAQTIERTVGEIEMPSPSVQRWRGEEDLTNMNAGPPATPVDSSTVVSFPAGLSSPVFYSTTSQQMSPMGSHDVIAAGSWGNVGPFDDGAGNHEGGGVEMPSSPNSERMSLAQRILSLDMEITELDHENLVDQKEIWSLEKRIRDRHSIRQNKAYEKDVLQDRSPASCINPAHLVLYQMHA